MAVMAAGVDGNEEGVCFAGAFLIGTLPSRENFARISAALEELKAPRVSGIGSGLTHAPASQALDQFLRATLDAADPAVRSMAVSIAAARRLDIRAWLPGLLTAADAQIVMASADAILRIPVESASDDLRALFDHDRTEIRRAAVMALLRIAPAQMVSYARSHIAFDAMFDGALSLCLGIGDRLAILSCCSSLLTARRPLVRLRPWERSGCPRACRAYWSSLKRTMMISSWPRRRPWL